MLYTAARSQLVIMTLRPGEEIRLEKHEGHGIVNASKAEADEYERQRGH